METPKESPVISNGEQLVHNSDTVEFGMIEYQNAMKQKPTLWTKRKITCSTWNRQKKVQSWATVSNWYITGPQWGLEWSKTKRHERRPAMCDKHTEDNVQYMEAPKESPAMSHGEQLVHNSATVGRGMIENKNAMKEDQRCAKTKQHLLHKVKAQRTIVRRWATKCKIDGGAFHIQKRCVNS